MCLWVPEEFLSVGSTVDPAMASHRGRAQRRSLEQRLELLEALAVGLERAIDRFRGAHVDAGDPQEFERIFQEPRRRNSR